MNDDINDNFDILFKRKKTINVSKLQFRTKLIPPVEFMINNTKFRYCKHLKIFFNKYNNEYAILLIRQTNIEIETLLNKHNNLIIFGSSGVGKTISIILWFQVRGVFELLI